MRALWFRLEAGLVRAGLHLLRILGPVRASNLAGAIARCVGPRLPVSRVADANLRRAMPELDLPARRRIVRGAWDMLGRTVGEMPHVAGLRRTPSGPGWEIVNEGAVRELAARGGPAILFSGHLGNWEILPKVAAEYGIPLSTVYRAADNPLVDAVIGELRRGGVGPGLQLFPKGAAGARAAYQRLAQGGVLGLLMDQKLNDGIPVDFFGQPAMTSPALATLALRFRCPVIPCHVQRLGPARLRLVVEPPLALPDSGDRSADIATLTREVNARLEGWIRERPESWLWMHRRWPKR